MKTLLSYDFLDFNVGLNQEECFHRQHLPYWKEAPCATVFRSFTEFRKN